MPAQFDSDLRKVQEHLLRMGAIAERMIRNVDTVLIDNRVDLIEKIYEDETELDQLQVDVDEESIRMIGVYTPVATDLRRLLMVTRINAEIERIGDQVVEVCHTHEDFLQEHRSKKSVADFRPVLELVEAMVRNALNAFVDNATDQAMAVIAQDDKVDKLTQQMTRALFTHMLDDSRTIGYVFGLIQIAQALEQIADHAVNICEDVVYIVKGKDIRHADTDGAEDKSSE